MYYRQYLKIQNGKLITTVLLPVNTPIMELTGTILNDNQIDPTKIDAYLQIGVNTFLSPSGGLEDGLSHNCEPNCRLDIVGTRVFLYSLYVIPAGTALNIDYSTTSTDTPDIWSMSCFCGSRKCRKIISGYTTLDITTKQTYEGKNMLPLYILHPTMFQKT